MNTAAHLLVQEMYQPLPWPAGKPIAQSTIGGTQVDTENDKEKSQPDISWWPSTATLSSSLYMSGASP